MKKYDVIVTGGGFAGCAAAIAAARGGARVLLIERSGCPGGAAANCLVNPYMDSHTVIDGKRVELSRGIFAEINARLEAADAKRGGTFSEEVLKIVLSELLSGCGVEVLYHALLIGAACRDGRVESVTVAVKSGQLTLLADYFIDATGDADLTHFAGFPYRLGRESDGLCQPMTLCFRLSGVNRAALTPEARQQMQTLYRKFSAEGRLSNPREDILLFYTLSDDIIHFNTTRVVRLNPTDPFDLSRAETEARRQVWEMYTFLKENVSAFAGSRLLMTAADIGVRESRMIDGLYRLTGEDLRACKRFDDGIAFGNYDIDIHNPTGAGTSHYYFKPGEYYAIPYRSLVPRTSVNMLVAGRCISVDHEAQASVRIMPIVCCIGEAAGTAAALAVARGCGVAEVDAGVLRQTLRQNGACC